MAWVSLGLSGLFALLGVGLRYAGYAARVGRFVAGLGKLAPPAAGE
jgi:hypothetical protein